MQTPLKVDFHGAATPEILQTLIERHVETLEHLYGRMTACHVGVEPPGHRHHKGGLYHVRIHISLPGGRDVTVGATPTEDERSFDAQFAINDAFRRAGRQMQDHVRRLQGEEKHHEETPSGRIARFDPNTGYGFIEAADGHEVYFDQNSVSGARLPHVRVGDHVTFVEEMGEKGPQASTVRLVGKHHPG